MGCVFCVHVPYLILHRIFVGGHASPASSGTPKGQSAEALADNTSKKKQKSDARSSLMPSGNQASVSLSAQTVVVLPFSTETG